MERVVQVMVKAVVNLTKKVVSVCKGVFSMAEEVAKRLVVNLTKKVVSVCKGVFSMAEEVAKRLGVIGPEVLLFGVLKCFLGGSGWIAFILEIIIILRPWKKD